MDVSLGPHGISGVDNSDAGKGAVPVALIHPRPCINLGPTRSSKYGPRHIPTGGPHARLCHGGFHSGRGRYCRRTRRLRYVIVCDRCLTEIEELGSVEYRPQFKPSVTLD